MNYRDINNTHETSICGVCLHRMYASAYRYFHEESVLLEWLVNTKWSVLREWNDVITFSKIKENLKIRKHCLLYCKVGMLKMVKILEMLNNNSKTNIVQVWCRVPIISAFIREDQEDWCKMEVIMDTYQVQAMATLWETVSKTKKKNKRRKKKTKIKEILFHNLLYHFAVSQGLFCGFNSDK